MSILLINNIEEFNNQLKSNDKVIVIFSASFCKPCRDIYAFMQEKADTYTNIKFIKVDIEEGQEISENYGIQSIPHFKFFNTELEIISFTGALKQNITESIDKLNKI
tara:strand:+ start:7265 stop:7585 length:321 start_codon:yes stop_codon:yes gene_type:complete